MLKCLRAALVTVAVLLLGSALACSHLRHLLGVVADKPEVRLVQVDVKSMSTKRMDLVFVLEVLNPNSFSVDIEALQYNVESMGLDLGKGAYPQVIPLKSHEKTLVSLPFEIDPDKLILLMKKYFQNPKELKVRLVATLYLGTAIGKLDMKFEEEKTIMKGLSPQ